MPNSDLYTPEEAKKKKCRGTTKMCVGDGCMSWRWSQGAHTKQFSKDAIDRAIQDDISWNKAWALLLKEGRSEELGYSEGFCGEAGDPTREPRP